MGIETLAIASLVGSVVSTGMGVIGAKQSADAASDSARYQAQVARNNEIIAQQKATQAAQVGAVQAQARDYQNAAIYGALEAGQGASGIDIDSPSSTAVRRSQSNIGRLDTATTYSNALQRAQGFTAEGVGYKAQAGLQDMAASNAQAAGNIRMASSLVSGATSFADKWMSYSNKGVAGF